MEEDVEYNKKKDIKLNMFQENKQFIKATLISLFVVGTLILIYYPLK